MELKKDFTTVNVPFSSTAATNKSVHCHDSTEGAALYSPAPLLDLWRLPPACKRDHNMQNADLSSPLKHVYMPLTR